MSDDPKGGKDPKGDPKGNPPPKGTDPKPGDKGGAFDPSKLSDEELSKVLEDPRIWKTQRLSELREAQKELKKREAADSDAEKKRLEEEGKYKELQEKTQKELDDLRAKTNESARKAALIQALAAKGVNGDTNLADALKLVDASNISQGEDGAFSGIAEAVDSLIKDRPHLITNPQPVGNPTNPGKPGTPGTFTLTQIGDPKFYQENRDAIIQAQNEGKIVDDRFSSGGPAAGQPPSAPTE